MSDEDLKAFVVPDHDTTAADLWEWCAARLAPFKVPRYIEFVEGLPRTPTRRIAKYALPGQPTGREHDSEPGA